MTLRVYPKVKQMKKGWRERSSNLKRRGKVRSNEQVWFSLGFGSCLHGEGNFHGTP